MVFGSCVTGVSGAVDYDEISGNNSGVTGTDHEWEISQPLQNDSRDGITVTFDESEESGDNENRYMSWSSESDVQVRYVWIKASNGGHLFSYTDETHDEDLFGPFVEEKNWPHAISHVIIYYDDAIPDLSIVKTASPTTVEPGDEVTYTIEVTNNGADATGVNVVDVMPNHMDFVAAGSDAWDHEPDSEEYTHSIGELASGDTVTITFKTAVSENTSGVTQISNTAKVNCSEDDEWKEDSAIINVEYPNVPVTTKLTITKEIVHSNDTTAVVAGDDTEFTGKLVYVPEAPTIAVAQEYAFHVKPSTPFVKEGLPFGKYQVIEDAEDGYVPLHADPLYITISEEDPEAIAELVNKKVKANVIIFKNLLDKTGADIDGRGLTYQVRLTGPDNAGGIYNVPVRTEYMTALLPLGEYTVEEVNPPSGYDVTISHPTFTLTSEGFKVTVTNQEKSDDPPSNYGSVKVIKAIGPDGVPQAGVEFILHVGDEDIRKTTDDSGTVIFEELPVGTYILEEIKPMGFDTAITVEEPEQEDVPRNLTVAASESAQVIVTTNNTTIVNVENTPIINEGITYDPGIKIKGYKFNDLNQNGTRDKDEPGLSDWKIELYRNYIEATIKMTPMFMSEEPIDTTTTDASGYYEFTGLSTGFYVVKEVQKNGWQNSTPLEVPLYIAGDFIGSGIRCRNLLDDTNFKNAMPDGNTYFEVEGRIGRVGDYELAIKTLDPTVVQKQKDVDGWLNFAEPQPFTLSYSALSGTVTFTALEETLTYNVEQNPWPDDIMIRTRSAKAGSGILITDLELNGQPVDGTSVAVNGERGTDILWISGADLYDFTLTGQSMMYWSNDNVPKNSELAYQIAVGRAEDSQIVDQDFGNYQADIPTPKGTIAVSKQILNSDETANTGETREFIIRVKNTATNAYKDFTLKNGALEGSAQFDLGEYEISETNLPPDYDVYISLSADSDEDGKVDLVKNGDEVTVTVINMKKYVPVLPTIFKDDGGVRVYPGDTITYDFSVDLNDYDFYGAYLIESPDPNTEYIPGDGDEWEYMGIVDGRKTYKYDLYQYAPMFARSEDSTAPEIPEFKVRVKSSTPRSVDLATNYVTLYYDDESEKHVTDHEDTPILHRNDDDDDDDDKDDDKKDDPGKPDLVVTKTDKGAMVSPGALVEYFITVENKGNAYAEGVKVYETVPAGTEFAAASNTGWVLEEGRYVYDLGLMNVGDKKEVKFVLKVNNPYPTNLDKILNEVEVKDNGTETATNDNKASDNTPVITAVPVIADPPVVTPPTPPTPPVVIEPVTPVPDLPFTGGAAEVELLFAGMGILLMAGGIALKKRK
jgi:uncharacterized repeat protein (TIGR01451 family)